MGEPPEERQYHFEDEASDVGRLLHLPEEPEIADPLKSALRDLLALLGAFARLLRRH